MPRQKKEQTNDFEAVGDSGRRYRVIEMTTFTEFRPVSGNATWVRGTREYFLDNGKGLNPEGNESYRIVQTDEVIRKVE
ncbi:hypothetical protein [Azospirillum palustre]